MGDVSPVSTIPEKPDFSQPPPRRLLVRAGSATYIGLEMKLTKAEESELWGMEPDGRH
jgi:hypothetical protein